MTKQCVQLNATLNLYFVISESVMCIQSFKTGNGSLSEEKNIQRTLSNVMGITQGINMTSALGFCMISQMYDEYLSDGLCLG